MGQPAARDLLSDCGLVIRVCEEHTDGREHRRDSRALLIRRQGPPRKTLDERISGNEPRRRETGLILEVGDGVRDLRGVDGRLSARPKPS